MPGNIATFHFPREKMFNYINTSFYNDGQMTGTCAELLFTDERFGRTGIVSGTKPVIGEITDVLNEKLGKANVRVQFHTKNTLNGKGYYIMFSSSSQKVPEPSFTWRVQLMSAIAPILGIYGYYFESETKSGASTSFHFVENTL